MVRWMCKVTTNDLNSAVELRNRLQLNTIRECLQNRRLLLLLLLEQGSWPSKCRKCDDGGRAKKVEQRNKKRS